MGATGLSFIPDDAEPLWSSVALIACIVHLSVPPPTLCSGAAPGPEGQAQLLVLHPWYSAWPRGASPCPVPWSSAWPRGTPWVFQSWEHVHSADTSLRPSVCSLAREVILPLLVRLLGLPRASGQERSESGPLFSGVGLRGLGWMGPSAVGGIGFSLLSAPEQPALQVCMFPGLEVCGGG